MRFWASWWSGNYADEGCTKPPFETWVTGQRFRQGDGLNKAQLEEASKITNQRKYDAYLNKHSRDDCSMCAVIDAESEDDVEKLVRQHFPDAEMRFCEVRPADYDPRKTSGGRFK